MCCTYNQRLLPYGIYKSITMTASQITSLTIVYSTVYSGTDRRKHQSYVPLAFVRGIHRWPVNSPHKGPVTRKMSPFDDVIMLLCDSVEDETILCIIPVDGMCLFLWKLSPEHHISRGLHRCQPLWDELKNNDVRHRHHFNAAFVCFDN